MTSAAGKSLPAIVLLLLAGCGYRVAGHADLLPKTIQTIAVPPFANVTTRYKLSDELPEAITREFNTRTRYKVVSDPNAADAILKGAIVNYVHYPTVADPTTGRATEVDLRVYMRVQLVERTTGKVLFTRPNLEVRERYEISVDPKAYFEESDAALARASKAAAQQIVTAILSDF
ncbi:MAG TPA: LptE family protein [Bryobacteraceae bacterium]|nr:LptE family protein [Bryobacteraceae bacterium]